MEQKVNISGKKGVRTIFGKERAAYECGAITGRNFSFCGRTVL